MYDFDDKREVSRVTLSHVMLLWTERKIKLRLIEMTSKSERKSVRRT